MGALRFFGLLFASGLILLGPAAAAPTHVPKVAFEGRQSVTYQEFVDALRAVADDLSKTEAVRQAHTSLMREHGLSAQELPLESFSRIRLAFEATRDGGLWDLRWDVTNQMPRSDEIWKQWSANAVKLESTTMTLDGGVSPSAIAECDELSALFAILARDMGTVGFVGLHWPVWNHVVAVWQVPRDGGGKVRIVVPTSQIFLSEEATLGTREIETRRVVFPYKRRDLKRGARLPGPLARFLIERARLLGARSTQELSERRTRLGGS
jgi:hypothetical protein